MKNEVNSTEKLVTIGDRQIGPVEAKLQFEAI